LGGGSRSPRYHRIDHNLRDRLNSSPVGESGTAGRGSQKNSWGYRDCTTSGTSSLGGAVVIFRTWTTVEQALKKQTIMAFEPMYLEILNNDMVGFANTTARDMLNHLFLSYVSITVVDLEHKWENMRKAWDPQQPVDSLFE
jgi:hypothetical protein